MSLIKFAQLQMPSITIPGGQRSDLPNAWLNSKKLGQRNDIPLAKGLPK